MASYEIPEETYHVSPDMPDWYRELVAANQKYYTEVNFQEIRRKETSPCGKYELVVSWYKTKPGYMGVSRGIVRDVKTSMVIATVDRNYPSFWSCWASQTGKAYLLCGEDYQGYSCVDLAEGKVTHCIPAGAEKGHGFCWIEAEQKGDIIVVGGCYWACPDERREYDFSNPDQLPYKILKIEDYIPADADSSD